MSRRIFVGDVQGCREELERLLEAVRYDPASDRLLPAGDLVNRGPDSLGTLRLLRSLEAEAVLGNHDVHLLRVARGERTTSKRDTIDDVLAADDRDELLVWLARQPWVRVWNDVILVHAALHPHWDDPVAALAGISPFEPDERTDFATRARYCDADGERPASDWPPPDPPFAPWYEHRPAGVRGRTLVFGHWSRRGLLVAPCLRGLDTGCVWGKELTAWIAEEDRIVSVSAARAYSPLE